MRYTRRLASMMVGVVAVAVVWTGTVKAQIAQQIPANALVVLKVSKLQSTGAKVATLAQDLGLAQLRPELADPLGALQEKLKISKGLNKDGDLAFCYIDPQAAGGDSDKSILILVPVSDYQAFLGNFEQPVANGDVTQVTVPDASEPAFLAHWGDYAAMSPAQSIVAQKPAGLSLAGLAAREFDSKDAVLYANMPALRAKAVPAIQQNRQQWLDDITQQFANNPSMDQRFVPVLRAGFDTALNIAEGYLRDSQAAMFGVNIGKDGLSTTLLSEFTPDSYIAQQLAQVKNTNQTLLSGLPDAKYWFVMGMANTPKVTTALMSDLMGPVSKELANVPDAAKPANDYLEALKAQLAALTQSSFGLIAPTAPLGQGSLLQGVSVSQGDAQALVAAQRKLIEAQMEISKMMSQQTPMQLKFTPNAKTISGVSLDQFQTQFNGEVNAPQAQQVKQMMTMMYGPEGLSGYMGAVGADEMIGVFGLNDEQIKQAIDAAKAKQADVAKGAQLASVTAQLPSNRMIEMYFGVDTLVSTIASYGQQMGMPIRIQLPPDLPPIGATVATEGSALRVDGYIPTQLVQSLIAAGMQAYMGMQGGGMGGPGGGGGMGGPGGL